jgi:hypothetical protein
LFSEHNQEGFVMGLWKLIFGNSSGSSNTKVRVSKTNNARVRGDTYKKAGEGKHVHRSYDLNTSSGGGYREYSGGENSRERSYNKKKR